MARPSRTRTYSRPPLAEGLVTHIDRREVDVDNARRQWAGYVAALQDAGWTTIEGGDVLKFGGTVLPRRSARVRLRG